MNWRFWQWRKPALAPVAPVVPLPEPVKLVKADPPAQPVEPDPDRMNPEVKAEWIQRLTSGEYKQGEAALKYRPPHEKSAYCCLGVLCEMAVERGIIAAPVKNWADKYAFDDMVGVPSARVVQWAELPHENPVVLYQGANKSLAELNDTGVPFPEIAKLIDEQL